MDTAPLIIGSKTRNGRRVPDAPKTISPRNKFNRPRGNVAVYAGYAHVDDVPLRRLLRFSRLAVTVFPKPAAMSEIGDGTSDTAEVNRDVDIG